MLKRTLLRVVFLSVAFLVESCVFGSVNKFYEEGDPIFDSRLEGKWLDSKERVWIFKWNDKERLFDVEWRVAQTNGENESLAAAFDSVFAFRKIAWRFEAALFKIGEGYYMDLSPKLGYEKFVYGPYLLPLHSIARVEIFDKKIVFAPGESSAIEKFLKENPDAADYFVKDRRIVIVSPTEKLRSLIPKLAAKTNCFKSELDTLVKIR